MTDTVVSALDDYVSVYIKLRDKKAELAAAFAEKEKDPCKFNFSYKYYQGC